MAAYETSRTAPFGAITTYRIVQFFGTIFAAVAEWNDARVTRAALEKLSDRELDVLRRIVAGQRSGEIAEALHLSAKTISTHKTRIMAKLQVPNTASLVRYGIQHGLTHV